MSLNDTIYFSEVDFEKKYVCWKCDAVVEYCSNCDVAITRGICFNQGAEHFCSKKCMEVYHKKNYSGENIEEE